MVYEKSWTISGSTRTPQSEKTYLYAGGRMAATKETTLTGSPVSTYTYYAVDHLGTVRYSRTYNSAGTFVTGSDKSYKMEPFGVMIPTCGTPSTTHLYTGQERDDLPNGFDQDYMHFRFYAANIGRFQKPDSVFDGAGRNPQGFNLYSYVHGNPVNFNDPTGHSSGSSWAGKGAQGSSGTEYTHDQGGGGLSMSSHPLDDGFDASTTSRWIANRGYHSVFGSEQHGEYSTAGGGGEPKTIKHITFNLDLGNQELEQSTKKEIQSKLAGCGITEVTVRTKTEYDALSGWERFCERVISKNVYYVTVIPGGNKGARSGNALKLPGNWISGLISRNLPKGYVPMLVAQATLHEFGHALGLYQNSDQANYWRALGWGKVDQGYREGLYGREGTIMDPVGLSNEGCQTFDYRDKVYLLHTLGYQ